MDGGAPRRSNPLIVRCSPIAGSLDVNGQRKYLKDEVRGHDHHGHIWIQNEALLDEFILLACSRSGVG